MRIHHRHKAFVLSLLGGSLLLATSPPAVATDLSATRIVDGNHSYLALAQLMDEQTPSPVRQQLLADAEQRAQAGDTQWQYLIGSMLAQAHPPIAAAHDPQLARVFLSNAAGHGKIAAMAKMAELELAAGAYQEAMNWAQIYAHYQSLQGTDERPAVDYLSELIARISDKFDSSKWPQVQADVNAFIAQHDAVIRQGPQSGADWRNPFPHEAAVKNTQHRVFDSDALRGLSRPRSSFADCLIGFAPDGSVAKLWMIDVVPDDRASHLLHDLAAATRIAPDNGHTDSGLRYLLLTAVYDDGRYHVRDGHVVSGRDY